MTGAVRGTMPAMEGIPENDPYADLLKELRGPVASIQSYVRTLMGRELTPSARATIHQVILQQSRRLDSVLDDVVLYVRLLAGAVDIQVERFVLASLVEEVRQRLGEPDRVEVAIEASLVVETDRKALAAALRRLLRNALVFGPREEPVRIAAGVAGGTLEIQVSDKGIGIPPEAVDEALAPFKRAVRPGERRSDGAGLGLSVAKELVGLAGGELLLRDNDPGLAAVVRLPS